MPEREKKRPEGALADFDGKPTGVEVTDLVEYPKQHAVCIATADGRVTSVRWKRSQDGVPRAAAGSLGGLP